MHTSMVCPHLQGCKVSNIPPTTTKSYATEMSKLTYELCCLIKGDNYPFFVITPCDTTIDKLKLLIGECCQKGILQDFDSHDFILKKVGHNISSKSSKYRCSQWPDWLTIFHRLMLDWRTLNVVCLRANTSLSLRTPHWWTIHGITFLIYGWRPLSVATSMSL